MRVLYLDVLFLINFCMDYVALYLAGSLCERVRSAPRLLLASLLGAVYAMAAVFAVGNVFVQYLIGACVSLLLTAVSYGRSTRRDFLRLFITFYAVSLLLGALLTVFYTLLNGYAFAPSGEKREGRPLLFLLIAALGGVFIRLAGKWLSRENTVRTRRVTVRLGQKSITFEALLDSGNLLTDPLSGRRVIVVSFEALRAFLPRELVFMLEKEIPDPSTLPPSLARRIRMIPVHALGDVRLLVGLLPDSITVCEDGKKGRETRVDAILGIDTKTATSYGGCDAVMPTGLAA